MAESTIESTWDLLREQWTNPKDIFTVLLIIGGDIVQKSIAQLTSGPWHYLSPVSFSFGWVSFAVSSMVSAFGSNELMPRSELDSMLLNVRSGYTRKNKSWLLGRLLRDARHWTPRLLPDSHKTFEETKLEAMKAEKIKHGESLAKVRLALKITVWKCQQTKSRAGSDLLYWSGLLVVLLQIFGLGLPPLLLYGDPFTLLITICGTVLAWATSALPQWREEKLGARPLENSKDVLLTEGAGSNTVIMLRSQPNGLDLEALAGAQSTIRHPHFTRAGSVFLASCWLALLITVAGWDRHTWYILGVGIIGMIHNVLVAGWERMPAALGLPLEFEAIFAEGKVMRALWAVETNYPQAGLALMPVFFPGRIDDWEKEAWKFAEERAEDWRRRGRPAIAVSQKPYAWRMHGPECLEEQRQDLRNFERVLP